MISNAQFIYGLQGQVSPTGVGLSGSLMLGIGQTARQLTTVDNGYAMRVTIVGAASAFALNPSTGSTAGSTAWTAGVAQVETATAAGTITLAGNASVTVTSIVAGTVVLSVAVALSDTAATWAEKVRTALAADTAIASFHTGGGTPSAISLARKPTNATTAGVNTYPANDTALNIALDNGTCTGITTAATSANTTAGALTVGCYIVDGDGKDWEGNTIPTITPMSLAILVDSDLESVQFTGAIPGGADFEISAGEICVRSALTTMVPPIAAATSGGIAEFTIYVLGTTV